MRTKGFFLAAGFALAGTGLLRAEGLEQGLLVSKTTIDSIGRLAEEPEVIDDIEAQNRAKADPARDEEMQQRWVRSTAVSEFVKAYQEKKSCQTMRDYFSKTFTLVDCFTLDTRGRVVGTLYKPQDFLQDGEPYFIRCYNGGEGRIYLNRPEWDLAKGQDVVEISFPVKKGPQTVGVLVATVLQEK